MPSLSAALNAVVPLDRSDVPWVSRALFRREIASWVFLPLALGASEGGVVGVLVANAFKGHVAANHLAIAVALVTGAPALASITSFIWTGLSHGRRKIRFLFALQVATLLCLGSIAVAPTNTAGLALVVAAAVGARMLWTGVVTLRTTVWRRNYPRRVRASLAGSLAAIQALMMTVTALGLGWALDKNTEAFRVYYPIACGLGLIGAWLYRGLRVRRERELLRAELDSGAPMQAANPLKLRRVLLDDLPFRRYMTCMFVFGFGNLMVSAPLVIVLRDQFGFTPLAQIMITTALPLLLMPVTIPVWSRLLDRVHIVHFRAYHSWAFVTATACFLLGAALHAPALIWMAAACRGVAFGGGVLGWNLGHHDFAAPEDSARYMGVHVTLTGLRGVSAPIIAIAAYEVLEWASPGSGPWVFAICLVPTLVGALLFVRMAARHPRKTGRTTPESGS